jgi:enoyl-CoA hydratase
MPPPLEVGIDQWRVALVRLTRPETRNALSAELRAALTEALARLDADPDVRAIVIAGDEAAFSAGEDLAELSTRSADGEAEAAALWDRLAALQTPTVAAVAGYALGPGCELALACDMAIADQGARFGLPEVTLGLVPGGGGAQRLTRAIGRARAMEHLLTGRQFDAKTALRWGLLNLVTNKRETWLNEAIELARLVADRPPDAVRLARRAVLLAERTDLETGLAEERALRAEALTGPEHSAALRAILERGT